jgi:SOS-response transcriptional repressor LexA
VKKFGDTLVLHPLNSSRYEDIELKKGVKYRIVGKVVKSKSTRTHKEKMD